MGTTTRTGLSILLVILWAAGILPGMANPSLRAGGLSSEISSNAAVNLGDSGQVREVIVTLLADEELTRRPGWQRVAADAMAAVSADFERRFGLRLVVKEYGVWISDDSLPSLDLLLDSLMSRSSGRGHDVVLALTGQANLSPSPYGFSLYQEGVILAVYSSDGAAFTRLLEHEWGHMFGAVHVADPESVMSHFVQGTDFDARNARLIALNKERSFNGVDFPLPPANRATAAAIYEQIAEGNRKPLGPGTPRAPRADERAREGLNEVQQRAISREVIVESEIQDRLPDGRPRSVFLLDDAHVLLAQIHLEEKDYEKALAQCHAALELNPENTETRNLQGVIFRRLGRYDDAIAVYRGILKEKPRSARFLYNLGIALDKTGAAEKAEASYRQALELRSNFAEAWNNLGELALRAGRLTEAEKAFAMAIAANDLFALAHANLAEALVREKEFTKAEAELDRAVRLNPSLPGPHNVRGNLYHRQGRTKEAVAEYGRAIELDPRYEKAYYNRGICRYDMNDLTGAEADFAAAVAINPKFAEAHASLGFCLLGSRKLDGGIGELELAEKLGASTATVHVNLSYAYLLKNMLDPAIDEARAALAINPELATAHNNLGIAFTRKGRPVEAADCFRRAVSLEPKYKDAFVNLAGLLAAQGKSAEALEALLEAAAIDPKDGAVQNRLAVLYYRKGDYAKALEHARQAQALGAPLDPTLAGELSKIR